MGWSSSLFQEVSEGLKYILDTHINEYSKGELVFLRKTVLEELSKWNITEDTYKPQKHFWAVRMFRYQIVNELYKVDIGYY